MTNASANSWTDAAATANEILRDLASDNNSDACIVGSYVARWDDAEPLPEQVVACMRDQLRKQGLTVASDDEGLCVVRRDEES